VLKTLRPVLICLAVALPALFVRLAGIHPAAPVALIVYGAGVVAAAFVLAWAAEAAEMDISGGLATALLALIAVLPEYAVDLYFAHTAGSDPAYTAYAAANMTGSNRLLLGLGWSVVAALALLIASRRARRTVRELVLDSGYRRELGFLSIAAVVAFVMPLTGQIHLLFGIGLLGFFGFYLWRAATSKDDDQPDLVGPAARIGALPKHQRRPLVVALFAGAAVAILASAEPFAESLVASGQALGIDQFLLVQWLAPLASESPELIVAVLFALRGKGAAALGLLIAAKVNQWTLLVGSLPVAYAIGGGGTSLPLDGRQVEEVLLTATQTALGVAVLLSLRFPRWAAFGLFGLFAVQFAIPGQHGRLMLSVVYAALAAVVLVRHRQWILPTLAAPFRREPEISSPAERELVLAGHGGDRAASAPPPPFR
jgi:cation:H+ antiporter